VVTAVNPATPSTATTARAANFGGYFIEPASSVVGV
jgi:hypothetical protein